MIRALVTLAALLLVVFAFILDQSWLYGAAAVALVGTLGYLGRHFWIAYRQNTSTGATTSDSGPTEDSLEDLGIMDVRPQEGEAEEGKASEQEREESSSTRATQSDEPSEGSSEQTNDEGWPESVLSEEERESMTGQGGISRRVHLDEHPVLGPFLESLRAAVGAQSVALLLQEEVALEYRIEAIASVQMDVQVEGTFSTQEPLLSAAMSQEPVTVRSVDDAARQDLGYYETVPAITQVALAPIVQPDSSTTVFLLADATAEIDLGTSRVRNLLARFARTVALLLDVDAPVPGTGAATDELQEFIDAGEDVCGEDADDEYEEEPRPRSEIIAEEMETADDASEDLALVLVHLNRAESIARQGEDAVTTAEEHLRSRLEDLAPGDRVERFGELTYGIFIRNGVNHVEQWAADLQENLAQETGILEGGVSVGVALRHSEHDPEGLRADATEALLEAYETGTCTIIG